jgi:DNA-directed RNA polymerase specialized sigma subunit
METSDDYDSGHCPYMPAASIALQERQDTVDCLEVMGVRRWIGQLPGPLRQIYNSIYVHGLTQRETARVLGVSQPRISELHNVLLERGRAEL